MDHQQDDDLLVMILKSSDVSYKSTTVHATKGRRISRHKDSWWDRVLITRSESIPPFEGHILAICYLTWWTSSFLAQ